MIFGIFTPLGRSKHTSLAQNTSIGATNRIQSLEAVESTLFYTIRSNSLLGLRTQNEILPQEKIDY